MKQDDLASGPTALASDVESGLKPSSSMSLLSPGDYAGDYRIVRHLGGGAMGDVYEGLQEEIGKRVAVKVIKNVLADSDEAAERFKREARAVNKIDHPNVLDVFAFGRLEDGRLWLAMDMLEGESLGARLRSGGAMELDEFAGVIEPIASALAAAHEQGIVHRDLKPDNVFLAKTGDGGVRVYVLDFGIAKILSDVANETGKGTLTGEGVWIGTPAYMAPEQWTSEGASLRSDIYALGAMAYEMLTGSVPYKAASVPAIMEKHFHEEVPHLDTGAGRQLPEGVDRAVRRAMAKKPETRFASASEMMDELRDAIAGVSRPAGKARAGAAPTTRGGLEKPRPLPIWAAVVGVLVLLTAIVLVVLMSGDKTAAAPKSDTPQGEADRDTPPPVEGEVEILFESEPREAQVFIDGESIGRTPIRHVFDAGKEFDVSLRKLGYTHVPEHMTAERDDRRMFALIPVKGFEGVWQLPDGRFREFAREQHRVVAWKLDSASGDGKRELGKFEFVPSKTGGKVVFARDTEVVDERNPRHPSCRRWLGAQYRYDVEARTLELRLENDSVELADGVCIVRDKWWGDYQPLRRMEISTTDEGVRTESTAGASGNLAKKERPKQSNKRRVAKDEKQLQQRALPDVSPRAADQGKAPNPANNLDPAPFDNVQKGGIEPAQRQTTRVPVTGAKKSPPSSNARRSQKKKRKSKPVPQQLQLKK